jgi:hypothetical protein
MTIHFPLSYLSEFLEEYPLYSLFGIDQPAEPGDLDQFQFNFYCENERENHFFSLSLIASDPEIASRQTAPVPHYSADNRQSHFTALYTGRCQSCKRYSVSMVISGASQAGKPHYFLRKIGQFPPPGLVNMKLPKELTVFLDRESREWYVKARKNLEMGYGTGALAYLSKIAGKEFDHVIEAVTDHYSANGWKIAEAFKHYTKDSQKSRLIDEITPCLPANLQRQGANILLVLRDLSLQPLSPLNEEEAIKKAKDIDMLLRHLLKKINERLVAEKQ